MASYRSNVVGMSGGPKVGVLGSRAPWDGGVALIPTNIPVPNMGYRAEFDLCWSNGMILKLGPSRPTCQGHLIKVIELIRIDRVPVYSFSVPY